MRAFVAAVLLCAGTSICFGQLTVEQKLSDFYQTSGMFIKGYGPYEWKKQVVGYDLADTDPWVARIRATKTDAEFYDVMAQYIGKLDDAHSAYENPSSYSVDLNFRVDFYDGKLLVDAINRNRLPVTEFPFAIGYELVSIDGEDPIRTVDRSMIYSVAANARSTRRVAANMLTFRAEWIAPLLVNVPEISTVVFRRFDGTTETYRIPWAKSGLRLGGNGKLPNPNAARAARRASPGWNVPDATPEAEPVPEYMKPLERLWNTKINSEARAVVGLGAIAPRYQRSLPGTFVQRLGRLTSDFFFSGTYTSNGLRIGLIRIPDYTPSNQSAALSQFLTEIQYMQANTDGLVIDDSLNPGGSVSYQNTMLTMLFHYPFRVPGFELRVTNNYLASFSINYENAKAQGAPQNIVDLYKQLLDAALEANRTPRGMTSAIPFDGPSLTRDPLRDNRGNLLAYSKPMLVLIDEFSASGGDAFAATMQDNGRATLFGWRTMGAGGNVNAWKAGSYSEGFVTRTESLIARATDRAESGYPVSHYIENVGVRPDIEYDYMTRENLSQNGKPYVDAFTSAIADLIRNNN